MNADTAPFMLSICFVGSMAIFPLIISFGLMGIMRQIGNWIESRWT